MKKLLVMVMVIFTFLLAGCDNKNDEVDLSGNKQVKSEVSKYTEVNPYGEVLHHGDIAKKVVVKNMKMSDDIFATTIGVFGNKGKSGVSLICDLRSNATGIAHNIKNDDGYYPHGNMEISIMQYRPGVTDIRTADEDQDPVFSTANGDDEFLNGLAKAASLPKDTVLAFVIDKGDDDGVYHGIAWSPLFTVEQLVAALPDAPSKCTGMKLDLDGEHLAVAEKQQ